MKIALKIFVFFVLFHISDYTFSQQKNKLELTGIVCDSLSKEPLPYCTILVNGTNDEHLTTGTITNTDGLFSISDLKPGRYEITYMFVGYLTQKHIFQSPEGNLPDTVFLTTDALLLNEVVITSGALKQDIDKLVMNTSQIQLPEGSDVIDLLKIIPGVYLSMDNTMSLIGKNVLVLIDDKPVRMPFNQIAEMLKSQSYTDILKIEIMFTTPPKYVDDWDGAVINIVTKKRLYSGFYGSISNMCDYGKHVRDAINIDLNYRHSHFITSINVGAGSQRKEKFSQTSQTSISDNHPILMQFSNQLSNERKYYLTSGISYFPNSKNTVDLTFYSLIPEFENCRNDSIIEPSMFVLTSLTESYKIRDERLNLFYNHNFNQKKNYFTIEGNYTNMKSNNTQYRESLFFLNDTSTSPWQKSINRNISPVNSGKLFLKASHNIRLQHISIESGLTYLYNNITNNNVYDNLAGNIWVMDSTRSNIFNYIDNTFYGYVSLAQQVSEKFSYRIASRFQNADIISKSITLNTQSKTEYFKVLPSIYANFSINKNNSFTLDYNATIQKPDQNSLNPFKFYYNPQFYIEGNPNLKPVLKNKFEILHGYKYKLYTSLSYERSINYITLKPVLNILENQIIGYSYSNFDKVETATLTSNYTMSYFKDRLQIILTPKVYYTILSDEELSYSAESFYYDLDIIVNYTIHEKSGFTLSSYYLFMSEREDGYNNFNNLHKSGIELLCSFLDNKLNLSLGINDIFNSEHQNYYSVINDINYTVANYPDSRYLRLRLSYSFKSKYVEVRYRRKISNEN